MSSDIAIKVKQVSKCYMIYDRPQDRLKQSFWRSRKKFYREFWALKNVSFEVKKGETVGIIGRNGTGKSTLLQIIAGTLSPTEGEVKVNGRVAALLELGSGFNPEFTGIENILMNGAILGISRTEMMERLDEIAAFADIGSYIEQPVKTYSSGMVVRLAFAVQAIVPKEVLIVDEALAVGDELFQRKCFAKIEEFKEQGGTILFVSHDGGAVVQLCNRVVMLDRGEQLLVGPSKQVFNLYQKFLYAPVNKKQILCEEMRKISADFFSVDCSGHISPESNLLNSQNYLEDKTSTSQPKADFDPSLVPVESVCYESRGAKIYSPEILSLEGQKVNVLLQGKRYTLQYRVLFNMDSKNVRFGMLIKTINGLELGGAVSAVPGRGISLLAEGDSYRIEFEFTANLAPGTYFLNAGVVGIVDGEEVYLDRAVEITAFKILPNGESLMTGIVDLNIIPQIVPMTRSSIC